MSTYAKVKLQSVDLGERKGFLPNAAGIFSCSLFCPGHGFDGNMRGRGPYYLSPGGQASGHVNQNLRGFSDLDAHIWP